MKYTQSWDMHIEKVDDDIKVEYVSDKDKDCQKHVRIKLGDGGTVYIRNLDEVKNFRKQLSSQLAQSIIDWEDELA